MKLWVKKSEANHKMVFYLPPIPSSPYTTEEVQNAERTSEIIKRYEDIIKTKKKGIIKVTYHQGQGLKKIKSLLNLSKN